MANDGAANSAAATVTITINPAAPPVVMYLSLEIGGSVSGAGAVADEDILSFNGTDFTMFFDGSDVGIPSTTDLDGFAVVDADTILLSLDIPISTAALGMAGSVPSFGSTVEDYDILQFDATSLGDTTSGTFSVFFDGSDVGLAPGPGSLDLDVDAIELLPGGDLVISTQDVVSAPGVSGQDEDMLRFTPTATGPATSGTWAVYFDGSDVGLDVAGAGNTDEDVKSVAVDGSNDIYLTTLGNFSVTFIGAVGPNEDVFVCLSPTTGVSTACGSGTIFFDGSSFGIASNNLDGIDLP
jgi:hypothetical protein